MLSRFGRELGHYPASAHAVPVLSPVLYTFLLRHALLDLTGSREAPDKNQTVEYSLIAFSVGVSLLFYWLERR